MKGESCTTFVSRYCIKNWAFVCFSLKFPGTWFNDFRLKHLACFRFIVVFWLSAFDELPLPTWQRIKQFCCLCLLVFCNFPIYSKIWWFCRFLVSLINFNIEISLTSVKLVDCTLTLLRRGGRTLQSPEDRWDALTTKFLLQRMCSQWAPTIQKCQWMTWMLSTNVVHVETWCYCTW